LTLKPLLFVSKTRDGDLLEKRRLMSSSGEL
jgi:hypothetical protein